jgi:hypothetical protein
VRSVGETAGFGAQVFVKRYVMATVRGAIEDRARRDRLAEHFFEADRLGAELDGVDRVDFWAAPLILDGKWLPRPIRLAVEFHNVGDAVETEHGGLQRQTAGDAEITAALTASLVRFVVQHTALRGEAVLGPLLLDVDERALARAEREVLQRRERDGKIVKCGQMQDASLQISCRQH